MIEDQLCWSILLPAAAELAKTYLDATGCLDRSDQVSSCPSNRVSQK